MASEDCCSQLACPGSTSRYSRAQEANAPTILKYSHSAATAMLQAFQGYATHLISKISQEHRAPFVLPELKMVLPLLLLYSCSCDVQV